jgi:hypothetical protein
MPAVARSLAGVNNLVVPLNKVASSANPTLAANR